MTGRENALLNLSRSRGGPWIYIVGIMLFGMVISLFFVYRIEDEPFWLAVNLHASTIADYSADPYIAFPIVKLDVIGEIIHDTSPENGDWITRATAVAQQLLTPIANHTQIWRKDPFPTDTPTRPSSYTTPIYSTSTATANQTFTSTPLIDPTQTTRTPPTSSSPTPFFTPTTGKTPERTYLFTLTPTRTKLPPLTPTPTQTALPTSTPFPIFTLTFTPSPTWTPIPEPECDIWYSLMRTNESHQMMWFTVRNKTGDSLQIISITAIWPMSWNGVLEEVDFGDVPIFQSDSATSPAYIPQVYPWFTGSDENDRYLADGDRKDMAFHYAYGATNTGYWTQVTFNNGCKISIP